MAKYKYIEFKEKGLESSFGEEVYRKHIEAFTKGTFAEPGNPNKNSIDRYIETFDSLIDSIKKKGFDANLSLVPIGKELSILDGAHRVSCSAFFEKEIKVIQFPTLKLNFGYDFFKTLLLDTKYLDYLVTEYCKLKSNVFVACVWPTAKGEDKRKEMETIIKSYSEIVCKKEVHLTYNGFRNFMLQIYGHQEWVGNYKNNFKGVTSKVDACFDEKRGLLIYVLECDSLENILELKQKIRGIFKISNHSIHISDNQAESIQMLDLLFNINSVGLMSNGCPDKFLEFSESLRDLKQYITDNNINPEELIVISDSVLGLYGIRAVNEIGFLTKSNGFIDSNKIFESIDFFEYCDISLDELLYNPKFYTIYNGVKFITLDVLKNMKLKRNEKQDQEDIVLINKFQLENQKSPIFKFKNKTDKIKLNLKHLKRKIIQLTLKLLDALGLYNKTRKVYQIFRRKIRSFN